LPAGSDAYTAFNGRVSCDNYAYWSTGSLYIRFLNLSATGAYRFVLFGSRGSALTSYSNRWVDVVISGDEGYTNTSSSGVGMTKFTTTRLLDSTRSIGANMDGWVVRYDAIRPGPDGEIQFSLTPGADPVLGAGTNCYINAFLLEQVPVPSADADGDGLPDTWETFYFGGTGVAHGGPAEDWDSDGFANLSEYLAGTDPTQAGSCLVLTGLRPTNTASLLILSWRSVTGHSYRVERSTNLWTPWQLQATGIPAAGPLTTYAVTSSIGPAWSFWRVGAE